MDDEDEREVCFQLASGRKGGSVDRLHNTLIANLSYTRELFGHDKVLKRSTLSF